jgi:hypothetical protein
MTNYSALACHLLFICFSKKFIVYLGQLQEFLIDSRDFSEKISSNIFFVDLQVYIYPLFRIVC